MKKKLCSVLAVLLLVTFCAGCTSSNENTSQTSQSSSKPSASSAAVNSNTSESTAVEPGEPVEIWWGSRSDPDANAENDKEKLQLLHDEVRERFNVELTKDHLSVANYAEKMNVLIASGDYPELVSTAGFTNFSQAAKSGLFLPLNDILENDPNWSTIDRSLLSPVCFDGQYYGLYDIIDLPDALYIRKDWLDILGLDIPKTPEELYNAMKAFTEQDPDGNGKNDTIGLSISSNFDQANPLFKMFLPVNPIGGGFYYDETTNTVCSALALKEDLTKAIAWFRDLYSEGILDVEFVVTDKKQAESKFLSGISGAWPKGVLWIVPRQEKIKELFPDAEIISLPLMQTKYGTNYDFGAGGNGLALTRAIGENEKIGKQVLAFLTGPESVYLKQIGVEGVTYTIKDGVIEWKNEDYASSYNPGTLLSSPFKIDLPVPDPVLERSIAAADGRKFDRPVVAGQSNTYNLNSADLTKVTLEGFTKIIIGEQPLEYLDVIYEEAQKLGLDVICSELTEMLES